VNECKPLAVGTKLVFAPHKDPRAGGLHSFPIQLNLNSYVHRITRLKS